MSGLDQRGDGQVLQPLGVEAVGLAPEREADVGVGIAADLAFSVLVSRLVGGEVGGLVAGLGGMVWMGIGALIMAKMVNFEI